MNSDLFYKIVVLLCFFTRTLFVNGQNWDYIMSSGEYYYGIGVATTEEEADKAAMADLISQIAINVSSDFTEIDEETVSNDSVDYKSRVRSCIKTYSQAALTNVGKMPPLGKAPNITIRRFMKKSELSRIFENRIAKAKSMLTIADECLSCKKIDMALQYYYWAYSLIRSVQHPNEVKDEQGRILVNWLPVKINLILSNIDVRFDRKEGDNVVLFFTYEGNPVSSLEFSYSDGRVDCTGCLAKDGYGGLEMIPNYKPDVYHINIEYEYKGQARGDAELESVLNVITPKVFPKASIKVDSKNGNREPIITNSASNSLSKTFSVPNPIGKAISNDNIQSFDKFSLYNEHIQDIVDALTNRNYTNVNKYFTIDGLQIFNRLTNYGKVRVLDTSNIRFYNGRNGQIIARGLKMLFTFNGRVKKTFAEDLSFTFNKDNKIENVAFGLGDNAEAGFFNPKANWPNDVREIILSFMENYKTAYSLERIDYIEQIFADDARIIIGNVLKPSTKQMLQMGERKISVIGKDIIKYNQYTKSEYIENLKRCFNRNDFINIKFTNHQIQWLEKIEQGTIFAINIRQEYNSSTYGDKGYLFLLVDMTNRDEPLIKIRTWQPNEVPINKLYNAGDFFND